jgi:hypothetical protein
VQHLTLSSRLEQSLRASQDSFAQQFVDPAMAAAWYSGLQGAEVHFAGSTALSVRVRYPGDRRAGVDHLQLELSETGRIVRLTSERDLPVWALGPVTRTPAAHGTVLSSGISSVQQKAWASRLDRASATVRTSAVLGSNSAWDGGLVVIVPGSATDFAALSGTDAADTGAVATCASGTPRIVINPKSFAVGEQWLQTTLVHEAVHVATDSPCSTGTAWVIEGVAESVSARSDLATASSNKDLVRSYLRAHGVPAGLPQQVESSTDYALAQVAIDQVRAQLGQQEAADFIARGVAGQLSDAEVAQAAEWYRAEMTRRAG